MKCAAVFPIPLPDDPKKWDGWSKYKSSNPYERLCLDPRQNPSNELIEEHCRELLRWWQKKLPLKNQPSNPVAQLLRSGLDESSKYLTEARVELLDPIRRKKVDDTLAAEAQEQAIAEFHKFLDFSIADGHLTTDEEKSLLRFGLEQGLEETDIRIYIENKLQETGAERVVPEEKAAPSAVKDAKGEFARMLQLSGLDSDSMTDDQRDAFINVAENLGVDAGEAEDMVDEYLENIDDQHMEEMAASTKNRVKITLEAKKKVEEPEAPVVSAPTLPVLSEDEERRRFINFTNSLGAKMYFIPSGDFMLGSAAPDATPNERPQSRVTLTRFYMSRFPVTNQQYEEFDPLHKRKRAAGASDRHPVVYVSSLEAIKFCQWLSTRERKKYRLPTEAEWEYAAKGTMERKYPWGDWEGRGDLANFADKNTVFAWSDREIDDGYAESSPVGAFPRGASPFGLEDMAGNVWEWCSDYYEPYRAIPKVNPRGPTAGAKRVYRGGSWKSRFASLRTTVRNANVPNYSCNDLGFRIVCECEA